jgi:hypothetical protein
LSLLAAGVVLFALLVATYSGRRFWIALASTAISMAAFVGFLFVAMAKEPNAMRTGLVWAAGKIQLVVDQPTAATIAKVIEQIPVPVAVEAAASAQVPASEALETKPIEQVPVPSPCEAGEDASCNTASTDTNGASVSEAEPPSPPAAQPEAMQATSTPSWPAAKPEPKAAPGSPVVWLIDDQHSQGSSSSAPGFAISGMNASDRPFEEVHAVLKPDGGQREIALALNIGGQKSDGVIPAGARFSLGLATAKNERIGGAILTFRYRQEGQSRISILYLTPSMISRLANRG